MKHVEHSRHSPLPWTINNGYSDYRLTTKKDGIHIAQIGFVSSPDGRVKGNYETRRMTADAKYIVEACNNYQRVCKERDKLLKKCDELIDALADSKIHDLIGKIDEKDNKTDKQEAVE